MDPMVGLFCFQGQEGTFNLRFQANMDEKSFKCSEKWKCKHLQFHLQLSKTPCPDCVLRLKAPEQLLEKTLW